MCSSDLHFHWMRKRIFSMQDIQNLDKRFTSRPFGALLPDFSLLSGDSPVDADFVYNGDTLYGSYSVASLALVKRS